MQQPHGKTEGDDWIFGYWTSASFLKGCIQPAYKVL